MLSQLFVGVVAFLALFSTTSSQQACNPGQPYGPLADGSCDPYVPPVNSANPTPADHTTGVQLSDYQLSSLNSLTNFVFLVLSEDSFDNLMATFPGVNNLQTLLTSNSYPAQINFTSGQAYTSFPADPTNKIPAGLPNKPYDIVKESGIPGVSTSTIFSNPSHNFHQTQLKINGGAENGWVYWSTGKSATMGMGYYDLSASPTQSQHTTQLSSCNRTTRSPHTAFPAISSLAHSRWCGMYSFSLSTDISVTWPMLPV